jgi:hypothetical protein
MGPPADAARDWPPYRPACPPAAACPFEERNGDAAKAELQMSNPTDAHVLFKVKTNASKRYGVKPHTGVLPPREQRAIGSEYLGVAGVVGAGATCAARGQWAHPGSASRGLRQASVPAQLLRSSHH